jgi:hypothetical protein
MQTDNDNNVEQSPPPPPPIGSLNRLDIILPYLQVHGPVLQSLYTLYVNPSRPDYLHRATLRPLDKEDLDDLAHCMYGADFFVWCFGGGDGEERSMERLAYGCNAPQTTRTVADVIHSWVPETGTLYHFMLQWDECHFFVAMAAGTQLVLMGTNQATPSRVYITVHPLSEGLEMLRQLVGTDDRRHFAKLFGFSLPALGYPFRLWDIDIHSTPMCLPDPAVMHRKLSCELAPNVKSHVDAAKLKEALSALAMAPDSQTGSCAIDMLDPWRLCLFIKGKAGSGKPTLSNQVDDLFA